MKILEEWQNPFESETDLIRLLRLLMATPSPVSLDEVVAFSCSLEQQAAKLSWGAGGAGTGVQMPLWEDPSCPYPSRHESFSL